jgi:hypothetical protein
MRAIIAYCYLRPLHVLAFAPRRTLHRVWSEQSPQIPSSPAVTTANKLTQSGPGREGSGDRVNSEGLPKAHAIVGWRGFEETVRSIPGATFDEVQKRPGPDCVNLFAVVTAVAKTAGFMLTH